MAELMTMAARRPQGPLVALKVDVDTKIGMVEGVPRLMAILRRFGLKASFYLSVGPDHSGRALKRLFRPGFLRKQLNSGAAVAYGPVTMLYGLVLPGPIIARQAPELFGLLLAQGHEVGLHAWDHVHWHDRVRGLSFEATKRQFDLGRELFTQTAGFAPMSFAAPGWQVTTQALQIMAQAGVTHTSCARGGRPFRPLGPDGPLPLVELPSTMPTMDEVLGLGLAGPDDIGRWLAEQVRDDELNVFTLHAEVEGRALAGAFEEMLGALTARGARFVRLVEAARLAALEPLPVEGLVWGPLAGRAYDVVMPASQNPGGEPA